MAKKSALGRGLGALIENTGEPPKKAEEVDVKSISEVEIAKIEVNPFQPRSNFDEEALEELSQSIKEIGIIQPITVRLLKNNKYQLITGERRLRAAKMAGFDTLPAYVRVADDQAMLEMALVENIQREDLDAIEVSISYQRLLEECKLTQESLSERVGKKRATVANYLRLLKLPVEIQLGLRERKLGMGHARTIINIADEEQQLRVYYKILENDLSVRATEELVRNINKPKEPKKEKESLPKEYKDLEQHLNTFFDTRVDFKRNNKGSGSIVIPFKSDEDLERIVAIFDQLKK